MANRIDGIEAINDDSERASLSDGAQQAIMQAALQKAQAASGVEETQKPAPVQAAEEVEKGGMMTAGMDSKKTEGLLSNSINQLALNNLQNLGINPQKNVQAQKVVNQVMQQAAMNKADPKTNTEADKDMANVAQGTTAIADAAKKDAAAIDTQQVNETHATDKMQEAKDSGLAMGVKIEKPDGLDKNSRAPEDLLAGSMNQLASSNMADMGISAGGAGSQGG